jgi:hypothetical protein
MLFLMPGLGPVAVAFLIPTAFSFCINANIYTIFPPSAIVGILLFGLIF